MNLPNDIITTTPDREIISTRTFNIDRETMFRAWTEPEHLKNWWGPNGFTTTFNEYDLRPGGKWSFIMHGPNNGNYPNECVFVKIIKPELVAWNHVSEPPFQVLIVFEEASKYETKVIFKMLFSTAEECASKKIFVVDKNEENFDRLEVELLKMKS